MVKVQLPNSVDAAEITEAINDLKPNVNFDGASVTERYPAWTGLYPLCGTTRIGNVRHA